MRDVFEVELVGGPYDGERRTVSVPRGQVVTDFQFVGANGWVTYTDTGETTADGLRKLTPKNSPPR